MLAALSEQRDLCGNRDFPQCCCHTNPWTFCGEALGVCRDEPEKVVDLLHPWDWANILQRPDAGVIKEESKKPVFYDSLLLDTLHRWCITSLKEITTIPKRKWSCRNSEDVIPCCVANFVVLLFRVKLLVPLALPCRLKRWDPL
jgi:hypothetical protein